MPTKPSSRSPRKPRPRVHEGYATGINGRRVGVAQGAVLEVLGPWLRIRFGTSVHIAKALGVTDPSTVRQFLLNKARLPESKADEWAQKLGRTRAEREAIRDLVLLANVHGRILGMVPDWEARIAAAGKVLRGER